MGMSNPMGGKPQSSPTGSGGPQHLTGNIPQGGAPGQMSQYAQGGPRHFTGTIPQGGPPGMFAQAMQGGGPQHLGNIPQGGFPGQMAQAFGGMPPWARGQMMPQGAPPAHLAGMGVPRGGPGQMSQYMPQRGMPQGGIRDIMGRQPQIPGMLPPGMAGTGRMLGDR